MTKNNWSTGDDEERLQIEQTEKKDMKTSFLCCLWLKLLSKLQHCNQP